MTIHSKPDFTIKMMRADYNSHTCLGCGRACIDPYAFCGRCISASRYVPFLPERRSVLEICKTLIFWLTVIGVAAFAWRIGTWIVTGK